MAQHHHPLLRIVIALVVIAAIAALIAFVVVRLTNRRQPVVPMTAPPAGHGHDAAIDQLRLRYARGEVSRTDYLQAIADLGGRPMEPSPT